MKQKENLGDVGLGRERVVAYVQHCGRIARRPRNHWVWQKGNLSLIGAETWGDADCTQLSRCFYEWKEVDPWSSSGG